MGKILIKFFLLFTIIFSLSLVYLSYIGLETDRFDELIKQKGNKVSQHIKIGFKRTKIHLNLTELNLVIKLQNPKVLIKKNEIKLEKLNLFIPIKNFFLSSIYLKRAEVAFFKNDIKDLKKITKIFLPKIINNKFDMIFQKGNLEGDFVIPFNSDGTVGEGYKFLGKISDGTINLTKDFSINSLNAQINHYKSLNNDQFIVKITNGSVEDIKLSGSEITFKREEKKIKVSSFIETSGKLNFKQIKKVASIIHLNTEKIKDFNLISDLKTNINFNLDDKFKVKELFYSTEGNIKSLKVKLNDNKNIKRYLPEYNSKITLKDTKIKLKSSKSDLETEIKGFVKMKDSFENFELHKIYNHNKKNFNIKGFLNLTNSKLELSSLNFKKKKLEKSKIIFDINFVLKKYYTINKITFSSGQNKVKLSNIKLNKDLEVNDFSFLEILTFKNGTKNNDFFIKKKKQVIVSGSIFDIEPLLKSLYKNNGKKTFSKKFKSKVKINFDNVLTGTNDDLVNFALIASINKGNYDQLSLKGNFSKNEIIEMSIYQVNKNKKTLQLISDRARPLVKNFNFIKGFEEGKLEYETTFLKGKSESNLKITDFKVSKVPALAKLLTLASLKGIADTLSGEGIRFTSFEMKTSNKDNILTIEDALAIGPAVSILLDGYVDKGKVVSLRGTLVPATKLNSIIATIPVVGNILVGKKTGEGVVGVSFKMKGPPENIKTSVNPIKTLTPRFIVRAVEKMKNKKKKNTK